MELENYLTNLYKNPQKVPNSATIRHIFLKACSPLNGQTRVRYALFRRLFPNVNDELIPEALMKACTFALIILKQCNLCHVL